MCELVIKRRAVRRGYRETAKKLLVHCKGDGRNGVETHIDNEESS